MVKIAIAGGSGQVTREVTDVLVATKKHEIMILSRKESDSEYLQTSGIAWRKVDYNDEKDLSGALRGIHTVLSFLQSLSDPGKTAERNLIDAAISAGVKRFAPSEYGSADLTDMSWWTGKEIIRKYLEEVNENEQIIEYTLFQPGFFLEYLASPYKTAKHLNPLDTMFDFQNARAIVVEGYDPNVVFTAVQDLAAIIASAVDYEGQWPTLGGIRGNRVTVSRLLEIGERVRGRPFNIEKVNIEDLEVGQLKTSWKLGKRHPAISEEEAATMIKTVLIGTLLSSVKGAWDVSDAFNRILPDHEFTEIEDYLATVWKEKS